MIIYSRKEYIGSSLRDILNERLPPLNIFLATPLGIEVYSNNNFEMDKDKINMIYLDYLMDK